MLKNFDSEFLQRCRDVTTYYENKEGSWSIHSQILKIYEELYEVQTSKSQQEMLEECCDVILATITMFDKLNIPHNEMKIIMEQTLQKVEDRTKHGRCQHE